MTGLLDLPPTPVRQVEPLTPAEVLPTVGQPPEASVQPAPAVQPAGQSAPSSAQSTPLTAITPGTAGPIIATSSGSGITANSGPQAAQAAPGVAPDSGAGTGVPLPASRPLQ
jgi:hypothetical protein